jgi:hypothetical protein
MDKQIYASSLLVAVVFSKVVEEVVQVRRQLIVHSQHHLARAQVGFQIDLEVGIHDKIILSLLEAADAGQFALFFCGFCLWATFDA